MVPVHAILITCRYTTFNRVKPLIKADRIQQTALAPGAAKGSSNPTQTSKYLYAFMPQHCQRDSLHHEVRFGHPTTYSILCCQGTDMRWRC